MDRLFDDLDNLNGIKMADLKDSLKKLVDKQNNRNPKEQHVITKCRLRFIEQLKDAINANKRARRGTYNKYKDLVVQGITPKQWRAFYQKYENNLTLLKKGNLSDERRKRLEEFNKWYVENRPAQGKRGRPKGTTKNSTNC